MTISFHVGNLYLSFRFSNFINLYLSLIFVGSSTPCLPLTVELDDDSPSTKKRQWTSSVWKHYNVKEDKHFSCGKDCAYCKYCNGGPVDADASNGTSNFRRHTKCYTACVSSDVGQMMMAKDGKFDRKFN